MVFAAMVAFFSVREKTALADAMRENLARVRGIRAAARSAGDDRLTLRAWQSDRLARTYADLLDDARYRPAARFFLEDLYGPKDFSERDDEVARILPTMTRLLPVGAVHAFALAIELDCLSEQLDAALVGALRKGGAAEGRLVIDASRYAQAYRRCANKPERERQVALVGEIGVALDILARKPLIARAVKMMHGPAHAAGLGELHEFLERGFLAFRHMQGASEFLAVIDRRERRILEGLFAGVPDPFQVGS